MPIVRIATAVCGLSLVLSAVGGCMSVAPRLESSLGQAVLAANLRESVNPGAGRKLTPAASLDGEAASAAIKRYYKSFANPPPTASVFTIGVSGAGAGATSSH